MIVGAALVLATLSSGEILTLIFGSFLLIFGYFFLREDSQQEMRVISLNF